MTCFCVLSPRPPAMAQSIAVSPSSGNSPATGSVLEEIIVTAQKAVQNLQAVPVAVDVIGGADAMNRGIDGTGSLTAIVPGLVVSNPANVGNYYLRGIGSSLFDPTSEQPVSVYVDGVYVAAPESNLFTFDYVDQIAVLKGPQGTLFGRNAVGGVIQVTTRDPVSQPSADLSVAYGNYGDVVTSGYVTGALAENLNANLAARYENQSDGYGHDFTTGAKTFQQAIGSYDLRGKMKYSWDDSGQVLVSADFSHSQSNNAYQKPMGVYSLLNGSTYPGPYNSLGDLNDLNSINTGGLSVHIDQDIAKIHLVDIVAYRQTNVDYDLDDDVTAVPADNTILHPRAHNWSEELELSGPRRDSFNWIVGYYYFKSYGGYQPVAIDGATQIVDDQITRSNAGFGQVTASIAPRTEFTLGFRYTGDEQFFQALYPNRLGLSQQSRVVTYRAALDHHFTQDVSVYASYNTGFKSGGFNLLLPGNSYRPEHLNAYEIGLKSELDDRRLRVNAAAFYYLDHDVQVLSAILGGTVASNAAAATLRGLEANADWLATTRLRLSAGLSWQFGKYTKYPDAPNITTDGVALPNLNDTGKRTPFTPDATGNISLSYVLESRFGHLEPTLTALYNSGFFWQSDNRLTQPAYTLLNASIMWSTPDKRYDVRLWGKNLSNATYYLTHLGGAGLGDVQEQAPPRTYGVTFTCHL